MSANKDGLTPFPSPTGEGRLSYDIRALQDGAVIAFQVGFLHTDLIAILLEFLPNPLCTLFVGLTIHRTRAKRALGSTEFISRVGIKRHSHSRLRGLAFLRRAASCQQTCYH